jgi:hypothetical protein
LPLIRPESEPAKPGRECYRLVTTLTEEVAYENSLLGVDRRRRNMCYVEIVGDVTAWSLKLTFWDRCKIGKFTRENVAKWLENRVHGLDMGFWPVDFHAVCGDIDIPWATKQGFECYQRIHGK